MFPSDSETEIEGVRLTSGRIFFLERGEGLGPKEEVAAQLE